MYSGRIYRQLQKRQGGVIMKRSEQNKFTGMDDSINGEIHEMPIYKPELEKAVLGALMIDKDAYALICGFLKSSSFKEARHQIIFDAIKTLVDDEKPVDILTVAEMLVKMGKLEEIGGPCYIAELTSKVASSAHIEYHARIIAEAALRREGRIALHLAYKELGDESIDVDLGFDKIENALFELRKDSLSKDTRPTSAILPGVLKMIQAAAAKSDDITGVPSFPRLDAITAGWQEDDFIIIAGRPSMGKTAFALCCAICAALGYDIPTAFFSLEMSSEQLMIRTIASVCEINSKKLQTGRLTPEEWNRIDHVNIDRIMSAPLYIDDTPGISIGEFRNKAKRLVRDFGVKCIFIDYLQLMNGGKRNSTRQEEVSHISRSLKVIAKELHVPIIALSQLNRGVEYREGLEGKRPVLSDLRESGAIEQDADMVLFVHRPEYYHIYQDDRGNSLIGKAIIILAKHRNGATGDVCLTYVPEYTRFEEEEHLGYHKQNSRDDSNESNNDTPIEYR